MPASCFACVTTAGCIALSWRPVLHYAHVFANSKPTSHLITITLTSTLTPNTKSENLPSSPTPSPTRPQIPAAPPPLAQPKTLSRILIFQAFKLDTNARHSHILSSRTGQKCQAYSRPPIPLLLWQRFARPVWSVFVSNHPLGRKLCFLKHCCNNNKNSH